MGSGVIGGVAMTNLRKFLTLARQFGIKVTELKDGHCQIHGQRLVNYWPESRRRTAHPKDDDSERFADPYRAIELAMLLPVGDQPKLPKRPRVQPLRFNPRWEG
jgi:hypothetical protein